MERTGTVPVAIDVAGPVRTQLERVVEGALGWQVVAPDDPVLPPRLMLVDPARTAVHAGGPVPLLLVTLPDDDPAGAARAAQHATAVLDGVPDAATLRHLAGTTTGEARGRRPWCIVAAAAGGVGATTVATALAGLRAWRHGPTLLAASGPTHQGGSPVVAAADLASPAVWTAAVPAVGLDGLRVVGLRDGPVPPDAGPVPLVLERGTSEPADPAADVLVVRPDRVGLEAAAHGTGTVVVVGRGPVAPAELGRAAGGRNVVACPWSARVAAAAAVGRLPADVPGTWLRPLADVAGMLEDRVVTP